MIMMVMMMIIDELIMEACCALKYFPQIEVHESYPFLICSVYSAHYHLEHEHDDHDDDDLEQICQNEKDGDILAAKKEMKLADEEDFGNRFFRTDF